MNKPFLVALALIASTGPGLGCIDTDTAVFVDATLGAPTLSVTGSGLGASLGGSFALELHLGARASGPSDVTFTSFSLKAADDTVLVESLPVAPDKPSPVEVQPGSDVAVTFTIDTGSDVIASDVKDRICAGQVKISGVIDDSLESGSSPIESEPFTPSCS
ncbi:MAG: hypothetical protein HOV80_11380 [Polyangiaceae bacterium]|nr:hypothetical protein [Polyangiaceae bacterium]